MSHYQGEFLEAARYGELDDLKLMASHEQLCELIDFKNLTDENGTTPLMLASANGHLDCVEYLLSFVGVDVNRANNSGNTALHWAALNGQSEVAAFLINRGADVRKVNAFEKTAFDEALVRDKKECCEIIAAEEAKVMRGEDGDEDMCDEEL